MKKKILYCVRNYLSNGPLLFKANYFSHITTAAVIYHFKDRLSLLLKRGYIVIHVKKNKRKDFLFFILIKLDAFFSNKN
jgi:hypothetical protein